MSEHPRRLRVLTLPGMRCDDGCGACCGPQLVPESHFVQVVAYANEHDVQPRSHVGQRRCPWYDADPAQPGRCGVWPARPLACHAVGHHPAVPCERGYDRLPHDGGRLLQEELGRAMLGERPRFLHEVLDETAPDHDWRAELPPEVLAGAYELAAHIESTQGAVPEPLSRAQRRASKLVH